MKPIAVLDLYIAQMLNNQIYLLPIALSGENETVIHFTLTAWLYFIDLRDVEKVGKAITHEYLRVLSYSCVKLFWAPFAKTQNSKEKTSIEE